ncbi:MAG TPA: D-alanine--D-alanine ligase [Patescibacteria group bacterium]|nr:D-alanine--D-alanine ligase [Patescibacteria group bacterium]
MASVIVLSGGSSDERAISLRSGSAVIAALKQAGNQVEQLDPADGLPEAKLQACDTVFPVLHGSGGEDGEVQKQLDDLGVAYVGSGVKSSELCYDKWQYKQFMQTHGLPTPDGRLVDITGFWSSTLSRQRFVLKPNDGGSSVDTYIHRTSSEAPKDVIADLFSRHPKMLLEELVEGVEITVGVLGDKPLPVIEIIPPESGEFDYENKYNGKSQELCPPEHVNGSIQTAAQELAVRAHSLCGCRDFSRTDIMVTPLGELSVLETNTIPGMTDQSLFPKAAATAGIPMPELVDQLVKMALARKTT